MRSGSPYDGNDDSNNDGISGNLVILLMILVYLAAATTITSDIVITERKISFTYDTEHSFQLQECGLCLHLPKRMITTADSTYDVAVKGLWGAQFVFPEGTQLISAVTSVSLTAPSPLDKPVTVQLMHCASITDQSQSKYLSFVISHSAETPFEFKLLEGGDFSAGSQYGAIQLKEFSLIAIVLIVSATAAVAAAIGCKFQVIMMLTLFRSNFTCSIIEVSRINLLQEGI